MDFLAIPAATALMVASAVVIHNYQPPAEAFGASGFYDVLGGYISSIKDGIMTHINHPEMIPDSLGTGLAKMFMIDLKQSKEDQMSGSVPKVAPKSRQDMFEKLVNPPTRTAVIAWIIFLLSAQYIYELHEADRYQKRFLLSGIVIGINASAIAWFLSVDNIFVFKTFIPASIIGALVVSSLAHRLFISKEVEEEKKDQ